MLIHGSRPVPYIVAWSAEARTDVASQDLVLRRDLRTGTTRLAYRDEHPADRDRFGVLWHRVAHAPGHGIPLYTEIHTTRQRRVMARGLCQICTAPADLWLVPAVLCREHVDRYGPGAPYRSFDPPVCRPCALLAQRHCPELRRGHLFLAPSTWAVTGIRGQVSDPHGTSFGPARTLDYPDTTTRPDHEALRLILAKGLIATLHDPTIHQDPDTVPGLGRRLERGPRPSAGSQQEAR